MRFLATFFRDGHVEGVDADCYTASRKTRPMDPATRERPTEPACEVPATEVAKTGAAGFAGLTGDEGDNPGLIGRKCVGDFFNRRDARAGKCVA